MRATCCRVIIASASYINATYAYSFQLQDTDPHGEYRIYSRNSRTFLTKILYLNLGWRDLCEETILRK